MPEMFEISTPRYCLLRAAKSANLFEDRIQKSETGSKTKHLTDTKHGFVSQLVLLFMGSQILDPASSSQNDQSPPVKVQLQRMSTKDPATTCEALVAIIKQDGGVIIEDLIPPALVAQIKSNLAPHFDTDKVDKSGFFPSTTQRATGLLAISDACVDLALNPLYNAIANKMISSTYTYWNAHVQETVTSKPQISSTVGFRVNPGGKQ